MIWLVVLLFIIALIFIPALRKVAGGITIIGVVLIGIILLWSAHDNNKREKQDAFAKTLIRTEQVVTENMSMHGHDKLTGRIYNKSSQYTIDELEIHITLRDKNVIVGETDESIRVNIPPGQAREIEEYLYFSSTVPSGFTWDFYIKSIKAILP
ncbi:MAG: hypothetical protein JXR79_00670 [Nitrospirae bacterium]|nr:hypothetical protein [Nitrospirota bacterium]